MIEILSTRHRVSFCPQCRHVLDTATSATGDRPGPGSFSVCIECRTPLKFGPNMELLRLSKSEMRLFRKSLRRTLKKMKRREAA